MNLQRALESARGSAARRWAWNLWTIVCTSMMLFGCASPAYRAHPEFRTKAGHLDLGGLMPCDMKFYEVTGYGVVESREDWSAIGRKNLIQALIMGFEKRGYHIKPVTGDEGTEAEIEEIQALYRSVNKSIRLHAYGPQLFPEKKKNFHYALGPIDGLLRKLGADSLIFVHAMDNVLPGGEDGFVSVAVADASGNILWYCVSGFRGENGLRDPKHAAEVMENIIRFYPEVNG